MRLLNGAGGVMYAAGDVAEFYLGRGWKPAGETPTFHIEVHDLDAAKGNMEPKAPAKRPARRRKADNGVDATK